MELNPQQQACDDYLVIDRWCGYKGHYVKSNKQQFIQHLHTCEKEKVDQWYGGPKGEGLSGT
jgi:hypothetical protein